MNKMKHIACTCGGSSLLMLNDNGLHAVWCDYGKVNRNSVLSQLRSEGWDIGNHHFQKKVKAEDQPPVNDLLLGKFKDEQALERAYHCLGKKMNVPEMVLDEKAEALGMVTAYRRLLSSYSSSRRRATG